MSWSNLPSTQADHSTHAVVIDSSDRIYAIGHSAPELTIERFDPSHPELGWTFLSPMPSPRMIQGTIGRDGLFYLAGGWFGAYTPLVHRYNPALDSWETYDSLINGRNNMGVVTGVSGRIYSTGGDGPNSTTTPLADVEYNDPYALVGLTILQPPQDQTVGIGTEVTFAVTATGTSQLNYQWLFNGTNISGAVSPALSLPNASFDKAGVYSVVVSNASGVVTNSAVLSLLNLKMFAGLTLAGPLGASYRIEYVPAVGNTNNWLSLTNVTLTSSPQLWFTRILRTLPSDFIGPFCCLDRTANVIWTTRGWTNNRSPNSSSPSLSRAPRRSGSTPVTSSRTT